MYVNRLNRICQTNWQQMSNVLCLQIAAIMYAILRHLYWQLCCQKTYSMGIIILIWCHNRQRCHFLTRNMSLMCCLYVSLNSNLTDNKTELSSIKINARILLQPPPSTIVVCTIIYIIERCIVPRPAKKKIGQSPLSYRFKYLYDVLFLFRRKKKIKTAEYSIRDLGFE